MVAEIASGRPCPVVAADAFDRLAPCNQLMVNTQTNPDNPLKLFAVAGYEPVRVSRWLGEMWPTNLVMNITDAAAAYCQKKKNRRSILPSGSMQVSRA
jgi:hypothetical protein